MTPTSNPKISWVRVDQVCLGGFWQAWSANRTIQDIIDRETAAFGEDSALRATALKLKPSTLQKYLDNENVRRKGIEDKAKTNLLGITLAFSVLFAGLSAAQTKSAGPHGTVLGILAMMVLAIGVAFLILGGLQAHAAMQVGRVYTLSPEHEAEDTEDQFKERMLWTLKQNERLTMRRSNALDVSFKAIRNGVLMLAAAVVLFPIRGVLGRPESNSAPNTVVICVEQSTYATRPLFSNCLLPRSLWSAAIWPWHP